MVPKGAWCLRARQGRRTTATPRRGAPLLPASCPSLSALRHYAPLGFTRRQALCALRHPAPSCTCAPFARAVDARAVDASAVDASAVDPVWHECRISLALARLIGVANTPPYDPNASQ